MSVYNRYVKISWEKIHKEKLKNTRRKIYKTIHSWKKYWKEKVFMYYIIFEFLLFYILESVGQ